jgi:hypothetical protein
MNMKMALPVLSINFPFKDKRIKHFDSLAACTTLSDFDVVVIRPHSIGQFVQHPVHEVRGELWVEGSDFAKVEAVVTRKCPDMLQFLDGGGILVIILDTIETLQWSPYDAARPHLGEMHKVTNYDFLDKEFGSCVHNGCGNEVCIVDDSNLFSKVIQNSRVQWTAFVDQRPLCPLNNPKIFARNPSDSIVGAILEYSRGHIVLLPNFEQLDEGGFLAACTEYVHDDEGSEPPPWLPSVHLPGEGEINGVITSIQFEIRDLQQERLSQLRQRESLLEYKKLLYEKGRTRLKPVVRKALECLGFEPTPPETIPGSPLQVHGRIKGGPAPGVFEVRGSNRQISREELEEFVQELLADLERTNIHSKGILIGNGFCEDTPTRRLGATVFSAEVLKAAERCSVALVNSVELYCIVCSALSKQLAGLEAIRKKIFETSGYVDLRVFCADLPPLANP